MNRRNRVQFSLLISVTWLKPTWRGTTRFFPTVDVGWLSTILFQTSGRFYSCGREERDSRGQFHPGLRDWTAQLTKTKRKVADADRPAWPNHARQSDSPCTWPLVAMLVSYESPSTLPERKAWRLVSRLVRAWKRRYAAQCSPFSQLWAKLDLSNRKYFLRGKIYYLPIISRVIH